MAEMDNVNISEERLRELEKGVEFVEKQISELQTCSLAFDELKNSKEGTDMLAQISPGVFINSKLMNTKEVFLDVGAKVFCKKKIEEAKKIIQEKLDKAIETREELINEIEIITKNLQNLQ